MSSLRAPWQNGPYHNQHIEQHKTCRTPRRNRHLEGKKLHNYLTDTVISVTLKVYIWFIEKSIHTSLVKQACKCLIKIFQL